MANITVYFPNSEYPNSYTPPIEWAESNPALHDLLSGTEFIEISAPTSTEWMFDLDNGLKIKLVGTDFDFDADGRATGGTLTGIEVLQNDGTTLVQEITDLNLSLELYDDFSEGADGWSLAALLLAGNDIINGSDGDDDLTGHAGNDVLNGGDGDDYFIGGEGQDTYIGGEGQDQISFTTDHYNTNVSRGVAVNVAMGTLIDQWGNVETFSSIESFRGSRFTDSFLGSDGDEVFAGMGGRDSIDGGGGIDEARYDRDDRQPGGTAGVIVNLTTGIAIDGFGKQDTLLNIENLRASNYNDSLTGSSVANRIRALDGNDMLNGAGGGDNMIGGAGNDTYVVDNAGDVVDEMADGGAGTDIVQSAITFDLSDGVHAKGGIENLTLTGAGVINASGNALGNTLIGNSGVNILSGVAGNDVLNGGAAADQMRGGAGNDTYVVDNANDVVDESIAGSNGTDTVQSAVSFSLSDTVRAKGSVENLTLTGAAAINATGNVLANTLTGNAAVNILNGMAGNDVLNGGAGKDFFLFNTALSASANVDTISGYSVVDDTIRLENAIFTAVGAAGGLSAAGFYAGAAAHDANDRVIYNPATGALTYDSNGNAAGGAVQFAKLATGLALTAADFQIV